MHVIIWRILCADVGFSIDHFVYHMAFVMNSVDYFVLDQVHTLLWV